VPLLSTENARNPTWSPDSRFVAFFADGQLKVIPAAGGPAQPLCSETGSGGGLTWNANGVILFASESGPLRRVHESGGPCSEIATGSLHSFVRLPVFMPDGNHFFYVGRSPGDSSAFGTYLAALDDLRPRKVLSDDSSVVYAPPLTAGSSAHLLFMRDFVLMAQPFDEARLEPVGDPFMVAASVSRTPHSSQIAASVAQGTLVYLSGQNVRSQLTWFDLSSGKKGTSVGSPANQTGVALSRNGQNAVIRRSEQNAPASVWVYDLVRGTENRLVPAGTNSAPGASWFFDDSRIIFAGIGRSSVRGLYAKDLNSSGQPELISPIEEANQVVPAGFSRDGRFLVYTVIDPKTQADIWYVEWGLKPDLKNAVKFAATEAVESQGQVSPNGRWMAFTSNAAGALNVYIRPFPDGPGELNVSLDGGHQPRWSDDSKQLQLYFLRTLTSDRAALFSSSVGVEGGRVTATLPRELLQINARAIVPQNNAFSYSPHPDGKRVLVNSLIDEAEPSINLITNWQKAIPERATH
jgi:Tol biopolymer transport system component